MTQLSISLVQHFDLFIFICGLVASLILFRERRIIPYALFIVYYGFLVFSLTLLPLTRDYFYEPPEEQLSPATHTKYLEEIDSFYEDLFERYPIEDRPQSATFDLRISLAPPILLLAIILLYIRERKHRTKPL
jgi:hypothetical protein